MGGNARGSSEHEAPASNRHLLALRAQVSDGCQTGSGLLVWDESNEIAGSWEQSQAVAAFSRMRETINQPAFLGMWLSEMEDLMLRKCADFLVLAVVGMILTSALVGYTHGQGRRDRKIAVRKPAPFVHTVIFNLKKDAPENATDAIIADTQKLLA